MAKPAAQHCNALPLETHPPSSLWAPRIKPASSEAERHCRSSAPDASASERALRSDASARGIYDYHVTRDLPDVTMTHFQQSTSPSACCSSACPSSSARTFSEPSNLGRASMYARAWAVCRREQTAFRNHHHLVKLPARFD